MCGGEAFFYTSSQAHLQQSRSSPARRKPCLSPVISDEIRSRVAAFELRTAISAPRQPADSHTDPHDRAPVRDAMSAFVLTSGAHARADAVLRDA